MDPNNKPGAKSGEKPDFKPASKQEKPFVKPSRARAEFDKKRLAIYGIAAILIIAAFLAAKTLTGYATYSNSLANELNETKLSLDSCNTDLSAANGKVSETSGKLTDTNSKLASCQGDTKRLQSDISSTKSSLDSCNGNLNTANSNVDSCRSEKNTLQSEKDFYQSTYTTLAQNYARDFCCRRGDAEAHWSIENSTMSCNGNNTVTC